MPESFDPPTQLTDNKPFMDMAGNASIQHVAFTPDSAKIGFVQGRRSDARFINVVRLDGTFVRGGNAGLEGIWADRRFDFTPSGGLVYAAGNLDHANYQTEHRIYSLRDLADDRARQRTFGDSQSSDIHPVVSPDGNAVAYEYHARYGGPSSIRLLDLSGTKVSTLSASGWSPVWVQGSGATPSTNLSRASILPDSPSGRMRPTTARSLR